MFLQKTIRSRTKVEGLGLHSGKPCTLTFVPSPPGSGVCFVRRDLPGVPALKVSAQNVTATGYATTLGNETFSVATVEHCLSALSALRIDNLMIELDGPEIPITDGSATHFLKALQKVGMIEQDFPRQYFMATEPFHYQEGDKQASLFPYQGLRVTVTIDFPHPAIGKQKLDLDVNEYSFEREISKARTFGFLSDVEVLQKQGLAKGASLDNAIGLDERSVVNPEGLRWPDEFVRHKALDALGDLVTLGAPLMGHLVLYKAGHDLMNKFVRALIRHKNAYRVIELGADLSEVDKLRFGQ